MTRFAKGPVEFNAKHLTAPFPWPGGKKRWGELVWDRFGEPTTYCEPFAGSLAVLLYRNRPCTREIVSDTDGFLCLAPETRVLDAELRYREIGGVAVGDKLMAFDEYHTPFGDGRQRRAPKKYRRWRIANVTGVRRLRRPCYRLTFDDGTTIVASKNHQWLCGPGPSGKRGWSWATTRGMVPEEGHGARANDQASHVMKIAPDPDSVSDLDYTDGWLGGFADGEGHINVGFGLRITMAQRPGATLDRAKRMLREKGFPFAVHTRDRSTSERRLSEMNSIQLTGSIQHKLRFLMRARPRRLIDTFLEKCGDISIHGRQRNPARLVRKEYVGEQEVVALETDTRTFIAEGLASHNCNFWRALRADPDKVAYYADYPNIHHEQRARRIWLTDWGMENGEKLANEVEFFDARAAGYWVWVVSHWIGDMRGLTGYRKNDDGTEQVMPRRPHLSGIRGHGIQLRRGGIPTTMPDGSRLIPWFRALAGRLANTTALNRDWKGCVTPTVLAATDHTKREIKNVGIAVFLDPPYLLEGRSTIYGSDTDDSENPALEAYEWAVKHGHEYRIAYCAATGDFPVPEGWESVDMSFPGVRHKERERARDTVYFSPACQGQHSLAL